MKVSKHSLINVDFIFESSSDITDIVNSSIVGINYTESGTSYHNFEDSTHR